MKTWFDKNIYHNGNSVKFLQSGREFFSELELAICSAKYFIHIQLYIFDDDETGHRIINLLLEASQRGVNIYIVVDGYASGDISDSTIHNLQKAGIHFKKFSPIHPSVWFRMGRRLHHKIILIDGDNAFVGGINIARKYEGNTKEKAWLDFAVKVKGPLNKDIFKICEDAWGRKMKRAFKKEYHHLLDNSKPKEDLTARLLQNDWVRRRVELSRFYRQSIKNADHSLIIVASYFIPGNRMRYLLRKASDRSVKITLLLSGISDVGLVRHATNYLYPFLFKHNIEIYEWTPSVLHGKLMIVDNRLTTIGSYNINALSDYGSLELNVCVDDKDFANLVYDRITLLIKEGGKNVDMLEYKKHDYWSRKAVNWISYQLTRTLLKLYFLLMKK